jgi:hypothetical protein
MVLLLLGVMHILKSYRAGWIAARRAFGAGRKAPKVRKRRKQARDWVFHGIWGDVFEATL